VPKASVFGSPAKSMRFWHTPKHGRILDEDPPARLLLPGGLRAHGTVTIGPSANIGPRSIVLYDATVGEGATLDALSLVMKGELIPPATDWRGIPARSAI
jgi:acetyltransferase-like isoleucine patch superfamily enzyme